MKPEVSSHHVDTSIFTLQHLPALYTASQLHTHDVHCQFCMHILTPPVSYMYIWTRNHCNTSLNCGILLVLHHHTCNFVSSCGISSSCNLTLSSLFKMVNICSGVNIATSAAGCEHNIMYAGADDFLPVLIYVLIHANPPQLASNLEYIQRFRMHSRMVSESAYFFTQLVSG